jgi:hypothetical protein
MHRFLAVAVAFGALGAGCCSPAAAGPSPASGNAPVSGTPAAASQRVLGEYLVTLAPGADVKAIQDVYGSLGVKRVQDLGRGVFLVTVGEDPGPQRMEELRAKDARLQAVQPNFRYRG